MALGVLVSDTRNPTESVSLAFNPGFPAIFEQITVTESVTLAQGILLIDVHEDAAPFEVVAAFTLQFQDTQGGGGGGGGPDGSPTSELWKPVWLIDLSGMTIIPTGYVASELRFSNQDIDSLSPPYQGRLVDNPTIDRRLMNVFWGVTEVSDVTLKLANADGYLSNLYLNGDIREQPIVIRRYDLASGTLVEELNAKIASVGLETGKLVIQCHGPATTLFEQLVPSKIIEKSQFPKAVNTGIPIPVVFGNVNQAILPYINDDTINNQYDYLVGHGTIGVTALYRNGPNDTIVTITTGEYSVSTTLYPGYTVVRFPIRQTDFNNQFHIIYADVQGPSRDFTDAIAQVLTDTTWGLAQTIDAASFATAKQDLADFGGMFCDGVLLAQQQAQDVMRQLMIVRGMRLGLNASGQWTITVDKIPPSVKMRVRDGTGDGERNISLAGTRQRIRTQDAVSTYKVKYRLNFVKGGSSSDFDFTQSRPVNGFGKEAVLEALFIREHVTADRVTDYLAKREKYSQETCEFTVTQEARKILEGDLVSVFYTPNGYANDICEVREVEKKLEAIRMVVAAWDASIYVYQPGTLPTDFTNTTGTLFVPRPGGLELGPPHQFLDQTFTGCDIKLEWFANSELYLNVANNEDNLPAAEVIGYYVTVIVGGVEVRREQVSTPFFIYSFEHNAADNPPSGSRDLIFKIQSLTKSGVLGEPNFITVGNPSISLTAVGASVFDPSLTPSESVTLFLVFSSSSVFDEVTPVEFVDVVVQGRRINVADYPNEFAVHEYVQVGNLNFGLNVSDTIDEYDWVVEIGNSKYRAIFVSDQAAGQDEFFSSDTFLTSNVVRVNVSEFTSTGLGFVPGTGQPVEGVQIARA